MTSLERFNNFSLIPIDWAGRSAVDRLLCKQEGSGPNPDRSIPIKTPFCFFLLTYCSMQGSVIYYGDLDSPPS